MLKTLVDNPDQLWRLLVYLSVFGLVLAGWYAAVTAWYLRRSRQRRVVEARLGLQSIDQKEPGNERVLRLWRDGEMVETIVPAGSARNLHQWLEQVRQDAGWQTPMTHILFMLAIGGGLAMVLSLLVFKSLPLGIALCAVLGFAFRVHLGTCLKKREALFDKQLVDALDLGARSLRAGHPLTGAFRLISQEMDAPIGTMFAEMVEQEALGLSLQNALRQAADRSRSSDMRIFAASVIIQLRSGGNLADMMERVAWVVRERMRLTRRTRVLTAEAQLSKWVLLGLPVVLFMALNIMNPKYMTPFFENFWGNVLIVCAIVSMTLGGWVMSRMAVLKY